MTEKKVLPNWQEFYRDQAVEHMPWYFADIDPDLARALDARGLKSGRALDLGTGPGTQAFALQARGFHVTASDLSPHAIDKARARATQENKHIDFVQDDILSTRLRGPFDVVFDRGCFHVFDPELRPRYVRALAGLVEPGGIVFLKCFSEQQPGDYGPYRLSPNDIEHIFGGAFEVVAIDRTVYQGTMAEQPQALFCTLQRKR